MTTTSRWLGGPRSRADRTRSRRARLVADAEALDAAPLRKIPRKRKARPRKRFDFALPAQLGAQIQLPSIPVVRFGPRLLSAVLLKNPKAKSPWLRAREQLDLTPEGVAIFGGARPKDDSVKP